MMQLSNFITPVLNAPSFETALPLLQMILSTAQSPNDLGNYWQCAHIEPSAKYCTVTVQQLTPLYDVFGRIQDDDAIDFDIPVYTPGW